MAKSRPKKTTIGVNREQHTRYRRLLAQTGLQQPIFIDRLLDLASNNVQTLLNGDNVPPQAGIRAAV